MEMQIFTYNTLFHSKWTEGWGKPESCSLKSKGPADWSNTSVFQISVQKNLKVWLHSDFPLVASTLTLKKFLQVSMSLNKLRTRAWVLSKSASTWCNMKGLCSEGHSLAGALRDQRTSPPESSFCFGLTQDLPETVILSIIFHGVWIRFLIVNSALAAQSDTSWDHLAQKLGRRFPEKSCPTLPRDPATTMTESLHWSQYGYLQLVYTARGFCSLRKSTNTPHLDLSVGSALLVTCTFSTERQTLSFTPIKSWIQHSFHKTDREPLTPLASPWNNKLWGQMAESLSVSISSHK